MEQINLLLQLPLMSLAGLSVGYLGYRLAFAGRNSAHDAIDKIALLLVFGAIFRITVELTPARPLCQVVVATVVTLIAAFLWYKGLSRLTAWLLYKSGVTGGDGQPTLWRSLNSRPAIENASRLVVHMKNGRVLISDIKGMKAGSFGVWTAGEDGAMAIYVTAYKPSPDADWVHDSPEIEGWGREITYIPADQIERVKITL